MLPEDRHSEECLNIWRYLQIGAVRLNVKNTYLVMYYFIRSPDFEIEYKYVT